jgi:methyl-accepting chemotaxis protein
VKGLRELTREIRDGVGVLASSTSEILATTTQVAAGAAETATAVSETTSTVEEVKQTSQVASEKARYVSETAQKSAQVSQTGRKSVDETIVCMSRIHEQMDLIAEGIVRLSEQGQSIGEIMASVNDLAEQSNLLAVNASIEAAKAGEQGQGFAVVAQEVRSLAQQSKQATAQVRTILTDFQKATSAAVLAAEQGSTAVDSGVKQSGCWPRASPSPRRRRRRSRPPANSSAWGWIRWPWPWRTSNRPVCKTSPAPGKPSRRPRTCTRWGRR